MERCDNCGKEKRCTKCELCLKEQYCSELCRTQAFVAHQADCNVYDGPSGSARAVPYMYEDFADEKDLRGIDTATFGQKQLVRTINPNGNIESNVLTGPGIAAAKTESVRVKAFKYGEKPDINRFGDSYRITIQQNQWQVPTGEWSLGGRPDLVIESRSMTKDMIYSQNKSNTAASKLSQSRRMLGKNRDAYVFWPGKFESYALDRRGGNLKIIVDTYRSVTGELVASSSMEVNYGDLQFKGTGGARKRARGLVGRLSRQLKIKGLSAENHAALYAKNSRSLEVRLIYETKGRKDAYLKDIELVVPVSDLANDTQVSANSTEKFSCDPLDVNQVTGLVMALEEHLAELSAEIDELEGVARTRASNTHKELSKTFQVISKHRDELEKNPGMRESPGTVNAAVHNATSALWVGVRWWEAKDPQFKLSLRGQLKKKNLPRTRVMFLKSKLSELAAQVGQKRKGFKSKVLGKRGKVLGRLRAFKEVVFEEMDRKENEDVVADLQGLADEADDLFARVKGE